jgi:predicted kinase
MIEPKDTFAERVNQHLPAQVCASTQGMHPAEMNQRKGKEVSTHAVCVCVFWGAWQHSRRVLLVVVGVWGWDGGSGGAG